MSLARPGTKPDLVQQDTVASAGLSPSVLGMDQSLPCVGRAP